jgi:hypothetical protein
MLEKPFSSCRPRIRTLVSTDPTARTHHRQKAIQAVHCGLGRAVHTDIDILNMALEHTADPCIQMKPDSAIEQRY